MVFSFPPAQRPAFARPLRPWRAARLGSRAADGLLTVLDRGFTAASRRGPRLSRRFLRASVGRGEDDPLYFRILGPLEIEDDSGRLITPPGRTARALLELLLLEP